MQLRPNRRSERADILHQWNFDSPTLSSDRSIRSAWLLAPNLFCAFSIRMTLVQSQFVQSSSHVCKLEYEFPLAFILSFSSTTCMWNVIYLSHYLFSHGLTHNTCIGLTLAESPQHFEPDPHGWAPTTLTSSHLHILSAPSAPFSHTTFTSTEQTIYLKFNRSHCNPINYTFPFISLNILHSLTIISSFPCLNHISRAHSRFGHPTTLHSSSKYSLLLPIDCSTFDRFTIDVNCLEIIQCLLSVVPHCRVAPNHFDLWVWVSVLIVCMRMDDA